VIFRTRHFALSFSQPKDEQDQRSRLRGQTRDVPLQERQDRRTAIRFDWRSASTVQALRRHLLAHDLHMSTAASLKPVQPARANRLRVLQLALEACGFNQLNQFFARSRL